MSVDLNGIITWLKGWFYDKTEVTGFLNNKANVSDLQTTNSNLASLQSTVDNKVDKVTGKGLSTEDFTSAEKTKLANIEAEANKTVVDSATSTTSTNPLQNKVITNFVNGMTTAFQGIDTRVSALESFEFIKVVSDKGTASKDTMNTLYVVSEDNKVNVYYTKKDGSTYSWFKLDDDILDELDLGWNNITGKPFTSIDTETSTTSTNPITNKAITTAISEKAPINHASTTTNYGVGTTSNYGHCKTINGLTQSSHTNGYALSAYQGKVLKGLIDSLSDDYDDLYDYSHSLNATTLSYSPSQTDWGEASQVATTVSNALTILKQMQNLKQDIGDCITSIELIPKTDDDTGCIRLYYGDEE